MIPTTHRKFGRIPLLFLLLALLLTMAACSGAEPTTEPEAVAPTTESGDDTTASADDSAAEPVAETETEMADGGKLVVAMQPIVQTDPALISSDAEVLVANHIYDYLVDVSPESKIIPRLATEWKVSNDGLTYVFTLADGVTWHDGDPFSAEDVVYTFDRLRNPDSGYPTADLYANIESVEATGDLEVTFKLAASNPFFLYDLSDNHALIIKNGTEDATNFNGTGPFILSNYAPEDRIAMVANENYFIDGQPKLDELEIIFFNDETASVNALQGGQVDLVMRMSTSLFQSLQDQAGINTISIPTNGFDAIRLRSDRAPGNNPLVMQALRLATDREAILQIVQQGYGAVGRDTPIGPLYEAYYNPTPLPPRDPEAAKALLAEAGYPDGIDLVLHTPDTGGRPDLAAVLQSQWAEAGFNVELSVEPESVYYGDDGWLEVDLGITGWGSRPYPQFYLDVMLVSDAKWNESHFSDSEFDELARIAGTTLDETERIQAYADIQRILAERGPVIIPYFFAQFAAIDDGFQGFELKAFPGRTDFRTVSMGQ